MEAIPWESAPLIPKLPLLFYCISYRYKRLLKPEKANEFPFLSQCLTLCQRSGWMTMLIVISCSHSKLPFQFFKNPLLLCNVQSRRNVLVLNYVRSSVISFMYKNYILLVGMDNLGQHWFWWFCDRKSGFVKPMFWLQWCPYRQAVTVKD